METTTEKKIVIHFLPSLGIPPEEMSSTGKAGYSMDCSSSGTPLGYFRLFTGGYTRLYPAQNILRIDLNL